ncbi:MAG: DUF1289 domain-containing protein [Sphingorhabdus sp.]|nr:DUF1289 domain-containing protein [Sphingorhabdus sp.]
MESPCNNICSIDRNSGFCEGCGRTLAEIAEWVDMGSQRRQAVMALLPARMKALATQPKG